MLDLILGNSGRVGVVGRHVASVDEAEMQLARLIMTEDAAVGRLVKLGRLRRGGSKCGDSLFAASREELGIAKALIVSIVTKEHGGILQEAGNFGLLYTSLLTQSIPVAIGALVQGQDEVVNWLRLWGDLSKNNSGASKAGPCARVNKGFYQGQLWLWLRWNHTYLLIK